MDFKRKLASLAGAGPGSVSTARVVAPLATTDDQPDRARTERIEELRSRIRSMVAREQDVPRVSPEDRERALDDALSFDRTVTPLGTVRARTHAYGAAHRHGTVPVRAALDAYGDVVGTLSLDASLRTFDAGTALFLDTETTGLAGGTGTLAFLVGLGGFVDGRFEVEQLFLAEPCEEPAMLAYLAARIARASALVSFNGKTFDLPLLRSRFVMARMTPPREPPHLDLLHVARRIYGDRVEQCRLGVLERDVLGFERVDDVPSSEIPARYVQWLRAGEAGPLADVVEHNLSDVVAMAALVGELAARATGRDASGRFDPLDMTAMARAALRAGETAMATTLAQQAAHAGARLGRASVAAQAHVLVATLHRRRGDHHATRRALVEALVHTPTDAALHLGLAKLYEHRLRDPERALDHARRAHEAEDAAEHGRRLARLEARLARMPLRLPGIA